MRVIRSIHRLIGLYLLGICCLLAVDFCVNLINLWSYREVVADLDHAINDVPRKADLLTAVAPLGEPLLIHPPTPSGIVTRDVEFAARLAITRQSIRDFLNELSALPSSPEIRGQHTFLREELADIDEQLRRLETDRGRLQQDPQNGVLLKGMITDISMVQTRIAELPDPTRNFNGILARARGDYQTHFYWLCGAGALMTVLLATLALFGRKLITRPIRELHEGTRRVAQGEYNYRLKVPTGTEMAHVAQDFNAMTARFQEIQADLNEQVETRSRLLVRSERLADIGILAAGVAHEINNPLSAVMIAAGSIEERLAMSEPGVLDSSDRDVALEYLEMIQNEASRCRGITNQLLDFSRANDNTRDRHDLALIVREVMELVSHFGKFRDRTVTFDRDETCYVEINATEIKQVILNLVLNGLEAMQPGGTMKIHLQERVDDVSLTVIDDGHGMTPEVLSEIFEPFFTQKANGKGTGLGLCITHRIVQDHGGTISPRSDGPGQGSTFLVRLPRVASLTRAA